MKCFRLKIRKLDVLFQSTIIVQMIIWNNLLLTHYVIRKVLDCA